MGSAVNCATCSVTNPRFPIFSGAATNVDFAMQRLYAGQCMMFMCNALNWPPRDAPKSHFTIFTRETGNCVPCRTPNPQAAISALAGKLRRVPTRSAIRDLRLSLTMTPPRTDERTQPTFTIHDFHAQRNKLRDLECVKSTVWDFQLRPNKRGPDSASNLRCVMFMLKILLLNCAPNDAPNSRFMAVARDA